MDGGGAAGRLWDEFRGLYAAVGSPTLASLVALGKQQRPPAPVSDTALSEWLTRKSIPGPPSTRVFLVIVAVLQSRAARGGYEPRPEGWWRQLLKQAQEERVGGQKAGRPRRPGTRAGAADRVAAG